MLFHVTMKVNLPVDMPEEQANQIKSIEKPTRRNSRPMVAGVISGEWRVNTQTSAFSM